MSSAEAVAFVHAVLLETDPANDEDACEQGSDEGGEVSAVKGCGVPGYPKGKAAAVRAASRRRRKQRLMAQRLTAEVRSLLLPRVMCFL